MPVFTYEALDSRGRSVHGQMNASSVESVIEELRSVHYTVTDVKQRIDISARISEFIFSLQSINLYILAVFTRQFATMLNAGIPLLRGLEGLVEQVPNKKLGKVLYQILNDLKKRVFPDSLTPETSESLFTCLYISRKSWRNGWSSRRNLQQTCSVSGKRIQT
jgi:type II secretory pathway component PulF